MIISEKLIEPIVNSYKSEGKKIVLVGGCFDVLHDGHIQFLLKSEQKGDALILLLESDENIKKLKGKNRPHNKFDIRAKELEKLGFIDLIVKLSPNTSDTYYYNLTKLIRPDIIALTKNDPLTDKKKEQAKISGGIVLEVMERDERFSSTKIIKGK